MTWEPFTQGNLRDTQALIESSLGLSRDTFLHSVFLRQDAGGSFPKADPQKRRQILADALRLGIYDTAHASVTNDRRAVKSTIDQLDGRIAVLAEGLGDRDAVAAELAMLTDRIPVFEEQAAEAAQAAARAAQVVREMEQAEANRRTLEARVRELEARNAALAEKVEAVAAAHETVAECRAALTKCDADMVALDETQERLNGAEQQEIVYQDAVRRRDDLLLAMRTAAKQADDLLPKQHEVALKLDALDDNPTPECDRCGQHLASDALDKATASLEADLASVEHQILDLRVKAEVHREAAEGVNVPAQPDPATVLALRARVMELAQTPARKHAAQDRLAAAERIIQQAPTGTILDEAREALIAARAELEKLPETGANYAAALSAREKTTNDAHDLAYAVNVNRQHAAILTDRLAQINQRADRHAAAVAERDEAAAELEVLDVLNDAFGPAGVPAWIVEHNALPLIEQHANHVLDRLGGAVRRVELRTERELKKGGTSQTLDVVCHTDTGARDFGTFSGGEQTRADIALRLGLANLLAGRSSDMRMLCLDEPSGLDAAGMEALVDVLRDITQAGTIDTVLLSSHVPALRDAFDTCISVSNSDGRSTAVAA